MVLRFLKDVPSEVLLKRIPSSFLRRQTLSTATEAAQVISSSGSDITSFRTLESNPVNHDQSHIARYYTIPETVRNQLYQHGGLPTVYQKQMKTFCEPCLMVRSPAVEILHYLKVANYSHPAIRYVIYGERGCGKTLTLAHVLHFGFESGFLIVHVPSVHSWMTMYKENSNSLTREGYVDLNMDAASWLVHFKCQNAALLKNPDLRISKRYEWSTREETEEGAPLVELIDHGIKRIKYASECVIALVNEIKLLSTQGRCKTLVVIDGMNAFFHPVSRVKTEEKVLVAPSKVTLTEAFLEITKYDWCNGAIVVTVDKFAVPTDRRESSLPVYLLGKEGFEHMDPFVPIKVPEYNEIELESCLNYYIDRRWIQNVKGHTEEGRKELKFLCGMNPRQLMNICASL